VAKKTAYQAALAFLARRDHFRRELEHKLKAKGYPPDEIEGAISRCEAAGLMDDVRVGERFVEIRAEDRGWGPHRLAGELKKRGVPSVDAEKLARLEPDLAAAAMRTALRKLEVRAPEEWWRDSQRRARMVSSLIARGFETDVAIAAVDKLAASRENHNHALDDQ
jgi:regulatory protein